LSRGEDAQEERETKGRNLQRALEVADSIKEKLNLTKIKKNKSMRKHRKRILLKEKEGEIRRNDRVI